LQLPWTTTDIQRRITAAKEESNAMLSKSQIEALKTVQLFSSTIFLPFTFFMISAGVLMGLLFYMRKYVYAAFPFLKLHCGLYGE
jgi:hypothetical protein